jgi:D-aminoacyl-tRNA deacylase
MKAVIQRVKSASVEIEGAIAGEIKGGLMILLGAKTGDSEKDVTYLVEKISHLRIFEDDAGKMNLSLQDVPTESRSALIVSQFTLYADTRKGRRPSFNQALEPIAAEKLYRSFISRLQACQIHVETGEFGAKMLVSIENDGPVTIIVDSPDNSDQ